MKMFPAFLPTMRSVACRIESFQNHITDELKREWHEKVDIIHTRIKFKLYNLEDFIKEQKYDYYRKVNVFEYR